MNERIKQLADEAGINYATGFGYSNDKVSDLQLEEFAELIVQECMNVVDKHHAFSIKKDIKEHFGVDE